MSKLLSIALLVMLVGVFVFYPMPHDAQSSNLGHPSIEDETSGVSQNVSSPPRLMAYYIYGEWFCYGDCEGFVCCEIVISPNGDGPQEVSGGG